MIKGKWGIWKPVASIRNFCTRTDVEATLVPNPLEEFYIRIQGIRETLARRSEDTPDIKEKFKSSIKDLGVPDLDTDQEDCLKDLLKKFKDLSTYVKDLWRQYEIKYAINLIDQMNEQLTYKHCSDNSYRFVESTKDLSLALVKREWLSDQNKVVSTYAWMKSNLKEDSHFRANETHIQI